MKTAQSIQNKGSREVAPHRVTETEKKIAARILAYYESEEKGDTAKSEEPASIQGELATK